MVKDSSSELASAWLFYKLRKLCAVMKITDKPVIVFLSAVMGAFVAGISTLIGLHAIIASEVRLQLNLAGDGRYINQGVYRIRWGTVDAGSSGVGPRNVSITFADFIETPTVTVTPHPRNGIGWHVTTANATSNSFTCLLESNNQIQPNSGVSVDYIAVGRWK